MFIQRVQRQILSAWKVWNWARNNKTGGGINKSPPPSHILMALLRKSIRMVNLNIAGRMRERNKSAGGKGARNNTGVALWWRFDQMWNCGSINMWTWEQAMVLQIELGQGTVINSNWKIYTVMQVARPTVLLNHPPLQRTWSVNFLKMWTCLWHQTFKYRCFHIVPLS